MNIRKRCPMDLGIVEKADVTYELCADFFVQRKDDFLYVVEHGIVVGIIDHHFRFFSDMTDFIQRDFPRVNLQTAQNSVEITRLFENSAKLKRLPVISDTGELLYEFMNTDYDDYAWELQTNSMLLRYLELFADKVKENAIFSAAAEPLLILGSPQNQARLEKVLTRITPIPLRVIDSLEKLDPAIHYGCVVNAAYPEQVTDFLQAHYQIDKIVQLQDVLSHVVITETCRYVAQRKARFVCLEIPFGEPWENRPLPKALEDEKLVREFSADFPEELPYLTSRKQGLANICKTRNNGLHRILEDVKSPFFNSVGGERVTVGVPESYQRAIHVYGECTACGLCTSDAYTIESLLQKKLNQKAQNQVRVFNHGVMGTPDMINNLIYILNTPLQEGDAAILLGVFRPEDYQLFETLAIDCIQTKEKFQQLAGRWYLNNPAHCNPSANELFASVLMEYLQSDFLKQPSQDRTSCGTYFTGMPPLRNRTAPLLDAHIAHYRDYIARRKAFSRAKNGLVVFNADPFTLGHRALLEYAASRVDLLYVMALENDASFFKSLDRFSMIELGSMDLPNVRVLTSGAITGTPRTFPEYFFPQSQKRDPNLDVELPLDLKIFIKLIAPVLNISVYYVGDEPTNCVSNKFIQHACAYMPPRGVQVQIIPRKKCENSDEIISASTVRHLYQQSLWEELKKYVPETTLTYLRHLREHQREDLEELK